MVQVASGAGKRWIRDGVYFVVLHPQRRWGAARRSNIGVQGVLGLLLVVSSPVATRCICWQSGSQANVSQGVHVLDRLGGDLRAYAVTKTLLLHGKHGRDWGTLQPEKRHDSALLLATGGVDLILQQLLGRQVLYSGIVPSQ
jgi:hypothetical protein